MLLRYHVRSISQGLVLLRTLNILETLPHVIIVGPLCLIRLATLVLLFSGAS